MALSKAQFAHLIPHGAEMNCLETIVDFDAEGLHAQTGAHRATRCPLRRDGQLSITAGIEFAAQAMALHGALMAPDSEAVRHGYLALVREVRWDVDRLDDLPGDLDVRVKCVVLESDSALYDFSLATGERDLMNGRAAVFFRDGGDA